ncbi:pyridoxal-phosphate dependent enzyme [uncultured Nitratireductor sp.]|uniref:pyridoxal-phosphate dependent enzyme n=1 Tax=uncultured Nitratireductor sp. TaxID=520953 RepID=UPI0025FEAE03|nr:pyridoxal-phosphate dependent enzyme [uncultured Nitratireductor sp.]
MTIAINHRHILARLREFDEAYRTSPLVAAPQLAKRLGVAEIYLKDESTRPLGSFKSLGGTFAGLEAIAASGENVRMLVCASDGNHGLAVASAARHAGLPAKVFLHPDVAAGRVRRIAETGAEIVVVQGTFDDAVRQAAIAAEVEGAVLIADTSDDVDDAVTGHVLAGYGVIAGETREQYEAERFTPPTHLFIQAGVGGLVAALARGLHTFMDQPAKIVTIEPENAACVRRALEVGHPETVPGDLDTCASMLSCGRASAPALKILRECGASAIGVSETDLMAAPKLLEETCGLVTTPSGAAGLAGLVHALGDPKLADAFQLDANSRVLLVVSEGPQE